MGQPKKKTVRVEIYETDFPILAQFAKHAQTSETAEAFSYMFRILYEVVGRIKEQQDKIEALEKGTPYIDEKKEKWRQAQLRKDLPFYG